MNPKTHKQMQEYYDSIEFVSEKKGRKLTDAEIRKWTKLPDEDEMETKEKVDETKKV